MEESFEELYFLLQNYCEKNGLGFWEQIRLFDFQEFMSSFDPSVFSASQIPVEKDEDIEDDGNEDEGNEKETIEELEYWKQSY